jgi:hypothetical protein
MQPSLRISHSRLPASRSCSVKRIRVQVSALVLRVVVGAVVVADLVAQSFHSMQATWQALQPMHLVVSISLATSCCWRTEGGTVVVAERAMMSWLAIRVSPR